MLKKLSYNIDSMNSSGNENLRVKDHQDTLREMIEMLYNQPFTITDENNNIFEIPEEGTLSLLAMGHKGIIAMRKKRRQVQLEQAEKTDIIEEKDEKIS
jgi:hypothetical protein